MSLLSVGFLGRLHQGGAFNDGIEVWQEENTAGNLMIKKIFRRRDLSHHAQREVNILSQLRNCRYVVQLYDHFIGRSHGYMYLECCKRGSLYALLAEHTRRGRYIPESFVWYVFSALVKAVYYMQNGPTPGDARTWNWIYHRDIHPGNVFITTAASNPGCLRVLLGDFGSAISKDYTDDGRVDMQAQEYGIPERRMGPTSDLYQIALVIVALCRLTNRPLEIVRPRRERNARWEPAGSRYSTTLNTLLARCLCVNPKERISVAALWEALETAVGDGRADRRDSVKLIFPDFRIYRRRV